MDGKCGALRLDERPSAVYMDDGNCPVPLLVCRCIVSANSENVHHACRRDIRIRERQIVFRFRGKRQTARLRVIEDAETAGQKLAYKLDRMAKEQLAWCHVIPVSQHLVRWANICKPATVAFCLQTAKHSVEVSANS